MIPSHVYPEYHRATPSRRSKTRGTTLSWAQRLEFLKDAEKALKLALYDAKLADSPLLAGKIRAAIKSCGGAIRHASGRESREYHEARRIEEASDHERVIAATLEAAMEVHYAKPVSGER